MVVGWVRGRAGIPKGILASGILPPRGINCSAIQKTSPDATVAEPGQMARQPSFRRVGRKKKGLARKEMA